MLEIFLKKSTTQENIKILTLNKRLQNLKTAQRENFKPEIKLMIENLQNKFYQLEKKQAKGAKLRAGIRQEPERKKCSKIFFKVRERQNMQNQTISDLYTDDNKSKFSCNPKDIVKSEKKILKNITSSKIPQLLLLNFLAQNS